MTNYTVVFKTASGDISVSAREHTNVLELAQLANIVVDAPCGGNGSCGKCKVQVLEGEFACDETLSLSQEDKEQGWCLACKSSVVGDATVEVPDSALAWQRGLKVEDTTREDDPVWQNLMQLLLADGSWSNEGKVLTLNLEPPTSDDNTPDAERVRSALASAVGVDAVQLPLEVIRTLPEFIRDKGFVLRCLLRQSEQDTHLVSLQHKDSTETPCALACDIGTTSVSVLLVDLMQGKALAQASAGNAQIRYGADVINRIMQQSKPGGIERLKQAIVEQTLNPLIVAACEKANVTKNCISHIVLAGNTTMNHLLLGVQADPLRKEPYVPCFGSIQNLNAGEVGLDTSPFAPVYVAPNVGSYVGGDITAGILASGLWHSGELQLFIDLGTNGELVFGNDEFMMCCACSAGPSFEGGGIRCGMRATDGAIEAATIDAHTGVPSLSVIGDGKPAGICGSGLIDVVSELFRVGAIDGRGRFVANGERFSRDAHGVGSYLLVSAAEAANGTAIILDEIDIENFVRAKGAIYSAISVMLEATGFAASDITSILIAGGIGSGINVENAVAIGLFPDISRDAYSYVGNTSLVGAWAMAQSTKVRNKVDEIASGMTYLELSNEQGYMDAFVAACFLPHTNSSLFPSAKGGNT